MAFKVLVRGVMADNEIANKKFKENSREVFNQVKRNADAAYAQSQKRIMYENRHATDSMQYKKAAAEYKASMMAMGNVNKKYAMDMKRLGISASGNAFSEAQFGQMGASNRRIAIQNIKDKIRLNKYNKHELRAAENILERMVSVDTQILMLEREKNNVIRQGRWAIQASNREMDMGMKRNNMNLKMYKQHLMESSMMLNQMSNQIKMGLTQALMTSTIALVAFGFKLSQIINDFREFEQELRNANSIWQTTNDTLYEASDTILNFGTVYGIEINKATEGLYQMASAGLTAEESQQMLMATLRLSMAVQGDHETLAKLTIQVLKGFGLEMADAAVETDRMAYAINKSLLQWEDLASGVKFAMPFFVSMNQETVQLYGALEVLADRALEAGISGRGLRQALAQFAKHADDNTASFNRMGIATQDANGNFLQLTEIAMNFREAFGDTYTDADMMTQLLEDFNVRGATAFVHLVQNAEEYRDRVDDLANATGAAKEMADKQNESISNQIQIMKNAFTASLFMSDATYEHLGAMNELDYLTKLAVQDLREFLFVQTETGLVLSKNGEMMRDLLIGVMRDFVTLAREAYVMIGNLAGEGQTFASVMYLATFPLRAMIKLLSMFGEGTLEAVILYKTMNYLIPLNSIYMYANQQSAYAAAAGNTALAASQRNLTFAMAGANLALFGGLLLMQKSEPMYKAMGMAISMMAGAWMGYSVAKAMAVESKFGVAGLLAGAAVGAAVVGGFTLLMRDLMQPPSDMDFDYPAIDQFDPSLYAPTTGGAGIDNAALMDMGGRFMPMYDTGGRTSEHGLAILQKGETVIPKTQNMLGNEGVTIIIQGDVYDGDNFAEKVHEALGPAIRMENQMVI